MAKKQPRIRLYWGKHEKDVTVKWDEGTSVATARYLLGVLNSDVMAQLDQRGYDTTTFKFEIQKKEP